MNTTQPIKRQRKVCECGQPFWTTAKFGNETKCDACYERSNEEFMNWFNGLDDAEQTEALQRIREAAAALGVDPAQIDADWERTNGNNVTVCSDVDDARQAECDRVAAELLSGVEI